MVLMMQVDYRYNGLDLLRKRMALALEPAFSPEMVDASSSTGLKKRGVPKDVKRMVTW